MNDTLFKKMVLEIVKEIDYDIFKDAYNEETAEDLEETKENIERLISIAKKYLGGSEDKEELWRGKFDIY